MVWVTNATGGKVWKNTSQLLQNITNSTSPLGAANHLIGQTLPWFWPFFPFFLYMYLMILYQDSPSRGKILGIATLVFVISIFMFFGGYLLDSIINFIIFSLAVFFAPQLKKLI